MVRTFVMGDIHGAHKALVQCLERSGFNREEDTLIQLGDICDGWNEVYECVEELFSIKNLIPIRGNHDDWFMEFHHTGHHGSQWEHGASATAFSYLRASGNKFLTGTPKSLLPSMVDPAHRKFFEDQVMYHIDDKNRLFIHGGFNRHEGLELTMPWMYFWDRDLWNGALSWESMAKGSRDRYPYKIKGGYPTIFIGHTTTVNWGTDQPMKAANIWNLDTGAGFKGRLTIMDVDTEQFWQSDPVQELYPDQKGRG